MSVRDEVFRDYNKNLDDLAKTLVWDEPLSKQRNYYVNEFGRQQVNASWRVEDYYEKVARVKPEDFVFG